MKKSDFEKLKPGMKLYRRMDIGKITRTIERTFISDFGIKFIVLVGDTEPRRWSGVFRNFNIAEDQE